MFKDKDKMRRKEYITAYCRLTFMMVVKHANNIPLTLIIQNIAHINVKQL
jgi:hypothetical protein